ncbi:MAG: helix-turn-helix domain-containing protein, partial [Vibrio sp.]
HPSVPHLREEIKLDQQHVISVHEIFPLWVTEKQAIEQAIAACDGNIPRAASYLAVSPSTIYRKLQTWNEQATEKVTVKDKVTAKEQER